MKNNNISIKLYINKYFIKFFEFFKELFYFIIVLKIFNMKYNLKLFDNITIENKKELVLTWLKNEGVSEEKINSFREALNDLNNNVENELSIIEDIANDLAYDNGFFDERDCMID